MAQAVAFAAIAAAIVLAYLVGRHERRVEAVEPTVKSARLTPTTSESEHVTVRALQDATDRLEIGVLIFNAMGDVLFRNRRVDELAGTHVGLVVDEHVAKVVATTRSSGPAERIIEIHGPPKQVLAITATPMPDGGVVATMRDVSERVRIDTMRTDFVANISHELRTPVGAIAVLAETLEDVDDRETVRSLSRRLVDEAHRAVDTIDDLMELSVIESRQVDADEVSVGQLVEAALARGRAVAAGRDLKITAIGLDHPLFVLADRRQVVSALGNLVENAVKYSQDGGHVQLRVRRGERWLELMVADQGVGIPDRDLDRVFERFYRVDKARGRSTGGSGLGLSIVRHVAHNHGGEISVSSQEGEGSTFVLRLPAHLIIDVETDEVAQTGGATDEEKS